MTTDPPDKPADVHPTERTQAANDAWRRAYDEAIAAGAREDDARIAAARASAQAVRDFDGLETPAGPYDDWSSVPAWKGRKRRARRK